MVRAFFLSFLLLSAIFTSQAQECNEDEVRQVDCNTCVCTSSGVWACTLMACSGKSVEPECTPGHTTEIDCNTCICGNSGVWACTLALCLEE